MLKNACTNQSTYMGRKLLIGTLTSSIIGTLLWTSVVFLSYWVDNLMWLRKTIVFIFDASAMISPINARLKLGRILHFITDLRSNIMEHVDSSTTGGKIASALTIPFDLFKFLPSAFEQRWFIKDATDLICGYFNAFRSHIISSNEICAYMFLAQYGGIAIVCSVIVVIVAEICGCAFLLFWWYDGKTDGKFDNNNLKRARFCFIFALCFVSAAVCVFIFGVHIGFSLGNKEVTGIIPFIGFSNAPGFWLGFYLALHAALFLIVPVILTAIIKPSKRWIKADKYDEEANELAIWANTLKKVHEAPEGLTEPTLKRKSALSFAYNYRGMDFYFETCSSGDESDLSDYGDEDEIEPLNQETDYHENTTKEAEVE